MPRKALFVLGAFGHQREQKFGFRGKRSENTAIQKSFYKYGGTQGGESKQGKQPLSPSGIEWR